MGKKKEKPIVNKAVKQFKETMARAGLTTYYYVGNRILSINDKGHNILIIPDKELMIQILDEYAAYEIKCSSCKNKFDAAICECIFNEDGTLSKDTSLECNECLDRNIEIKKKPTVKELTADPRGITMRELDLTNPEQTEMNTWFKYGDDLENDWLHIDIDNSLHTGKIFNIKMKDFSYKIPINRELMPLRLRKKEYEDVSYRVFSRPILLLAIKKEYKPLKDLEGSGFSMIRLFQIV